MSKFLAVLAMSIFSISSFASINLEGFDKRFKLVKNDKGEVTYVKMNFLTKDFSIKPYIKQIKNDIKEEVLRMKTKSYDQELEMFLAELEEGSEKNQEVQENIFAIRDSLKNLDNIKVDIIFNKLQKEGVLEKFRKELKAALDKYSLAVIASTEDPRYFYKRNVTYEVVKRALEFAKKKFSDVPLLNLASFVIVKVHDLVLEQRLFHQNMLLHYLQNVDEAELGLTVAEADKIFSSIYESRISAVNYRESNSAAANWAKYGLSKFYATVRTANNKLRRSSRTLEAVQRYNFAFFEAKEDGQRVVKNLIHTKHSWSGKMAIAYYYDEPNKVKRFRSLLNLGQLGLGFLPIPGWLKGQAESFIESYYVEQKRLEGALVGYFESQSDTLMAKNIGRQLINPYILFN